MLAEDERSARLAAARASAADLVDARLGQLRDEHWPEHLRRAAGEIETVLSSLARDSDFWESIAGEGAVVMAASPAMLSQVSEAMRLDLTGLLNLMGYRPPPAAEEIGAEMQIAFGDAIREPDPARRRPLAREAAQRMSLYCFRLRRLLAEVDRAAPAEESQVRERLLVMARTGVRVIVPAAIAAGVMALLAPPAAAATLAGVAVAGLTEATKEALKEGVQVGSAALLTDILGDQEAKVDPVERFLATRDAFQSSVRDVVAWANYALDPSATDRAPVGLTAYVLEAMHWSFELQRAELSLGGQPGLAASSFTAKAVTAALVDLQDWARREPDLAVLADVRDRLRAAYHQMGQRVQEAPTPVLVDDGAAEVASSLAASIAAGRASREAALDAMVGRAADNSGTEEAASARAADEGHRRGTMGL